MKLISTRLYTLLLTFSTALSFFHIVFWEFYHSTHTTSRFIFKGIHLHDTSLIQDMFYCDDFKNYYKFLEQY